jgi:hypothetical protein
MHHDNDFNFDDWARLAQTDPAAFEGRRQAWVEGLIAQAPDALRLRLRGLQFQIDMERRRARTPMGSCLRLSSLMWQTFAGENGFQAQLNDLVAQLNGQPAASRAAPATAKARVLPFPIAKPVLDEA